MLRSSPNIVVLTVGDLLTDARNLINDQTEPLRYTDDDLVGAFNESLIQVRYRRPELFLPLGLRNPIPRYIMPDDMLTPFPLQDIVFPACVYYTAGRMDMKDDTFGDDKRAVALLTRFSQMLLTNQ